MPPKRPSASPAPTRPQHTGALQPSGGQARTTDATSPAAPDPPRREAFVWLRERSQIIGHWVREDAIRQLRGHSQAASRWVRQDATRWVREDAPRQLRGYGQTFGRWVREDVMGQLEERAEAMRRRGVVVHRRQFGVALLLVILALVYLGLRAGAAPTHDLVHKMMTPKLTWSPDTCSTLESHTAEAWAAHAEAEACASRAEQRAVQAETRAAQADARVVQADSKPAGDSADMCSTMESRAAEGGPHTLKRKRAHRSWRCGSCRRRRE